MQVAAHQAEARRADFEAARLLSEMADLKLQAAEHSRAPPAPEPIQEQLPSSQQPAQLEGTQAAVMQQWQQEKQHLQVRWSCGA